MNILKIRIFKYNCIDLNRNGEGIKKVKEDLN